MWDHHLCCRLFSIFRSTIFLYRQTEDTNSAKQKGCASYFNGIIKYQEKKNGNLKKFLSYLVKRPKIVLKLEKQPPIVFFFFLTNLFLTLLPFFISAKTTSSLIANSFPSHFDLALSLPLSLPLSSLPQGIKIRYNNSSIKG